MSFMSRLVGAGSQEKVEVSSVSSTEEDARQMLVNKMKKDMESERQQMAKEKEKWTTKLVWG